LSQEVERQRREKEKGGGLKAKLHATRDGLGILRFKTLIFPRKKKR